MQSYAGSGTVSLSLSTQPRINRTYESTYYVQSPKDFTNINIKILIKNSKHYPCPYYTEEETEDREVKGLSQGHRGSRFWNQDSNPDSSAMAFTTHCLSRPYHLLPVLQTTVFSSPSVSQMFLQPQCSSVLYMFTLPEEFSPAGTFWSFLSEPECMYLGGVPWMPSKVKSLLYHSLFLFLAYIFHRIHHNL